MSETRQDKHSRDGAPKGTFTLRIKASWLRTALVVLVVGAVIAPLAAYAANRFTDVPNSNIFHDDIAWLADADVTRGCNPPDNTEFCPADNVTREQMAAFMRRLAENQVVDANTANTAGNADTLDGYQASSLHSVHATRDSDLGTREDPVPDANGIATLQEITFTAPTDGFITISANVFVANTDTNPTGQVATFATLDWDGTAGQLFASSAAVSVEEFAASGESGNGGMITSTATIAVGPGQHTVGHQLLTGSSPTLEYNAETLSVQFTPFGTATTE